MGTIIALEGQEVQDLQPGVGFTEGLPLPSTGSLQAAASAQPQPAALASYPLGVALSSHEGKGRRDPLLPPQLTWAQLSSQVGPKVGGKQCLPLLPPSWGPSPVPR